MAILLAIPILGLLIIFQSAILSQVHLLQGTVDLVLLALVAWSVQERVKTAGHWAVIAGLLSSLVSALPVTAMRRFESELVIDLLDQLTKVPKSNKS